MDRTGQHRHRPHGPGDVDASLIIRPDGCVAWALPTGQGLVATTLVRALGTWIGRAALTVVSDSLGMKQASDERCNPYVGG
ncbi:aromatic-ring hydroxylase C-terminal domain-containing protein [Micromonospora ureilytica]|uniref:aromatic-ring hydroxylase C-terminal domain-containing protein n=1 Tax=Micromonospora ureilytica TaxID=709868 RepID=UPI0035576663